MFHRDHYRILGVPQTATHGQIRAAYRRLARQLHPDARPGDPRAAREFALVSRAWEVLGNAARREAYDERRRRGMFAPPGTGGPATVTLEGTEAPYHSDLGHHSDFYELGDPLTVREAAALVRRHEDWLRRAIRTGRLPAARESGLYLVRKRDVERLDRTTTRRPTRGRA